MIRPAATSATTCSAGRGTARTECAATPIRSPGPSRSAATRSAQASTDPSENRRWTPSTRRSPASMLTSAAR